MVHEKLYQSDSFSDISLEQYIDELLAFISDTYKHAFLPGEGGNIYLEVESGGGACFKVTFTISAK